MQKNRVNIIKMSLIKNWNKYLLNIFSISLIFHRKYQMTLVNTQYNIFMKWKSLTIEVHYLCKYRTFIFLTTENTSQYIFYCSLVSVASVCKVIHSRLIHFLFAKWSYQFYHLKCSCRQAATQLTRIIKLVGHLSVSTGHSNDLQPTSCLLKSYLSNLLNTDRFKANINLFANCLPERKK